MKELIIPFFELQAIKVDQASSLLDELNRNTINIAPWPEFSYKPDVSFAIAHTPDSILLKYYVSEAHIQAHYGSTNDPVFKDSCVEFFIALGDEKEYYNFEFNLAGICQAGFGSGKDGRTFLPKHKIERISTCFRLQTNPQSKPYPFYWELTLTIPFESFCYHQLSSLKGTSSRVNFYKCGDELPIPHFLCWNEIRSESPNFHLQEFFGSARFN